MAQWRQGLGSPLSPARPDGALMGARSAAAVLPDQDDGGTDQQCREDGNPNRFEQISDRCGSGGTASVAPSPMTAAAGGRPKVSSSIVVTPAYHREGHPEA
jgi:hypothetical protein